MTQQQKTDEQKAADRDGQQGTTNWAPPDTRDTAESYDAWLNRHLQRAYDAGRAERTAEITAQLTTVADTLRALLEAAEHSGGPGFIGAGRARTTE